MNNNGWGKAHASMYTGSMIGSGAIYFAVWNYVIANMLPDADLGMAVELNPRLIAFILGEDEADVEKTVRRMCEPDPKSRTKDEEGRKLLKTGEFEYRVVNGLKYRAQRDAEDRKKTNREAQQRCRAKKRAKPRSSGSARERQQLKEWQAGEIPTGQLGVDDPIPPDDPPEAPSI